MTLSAVQRVKADLRVRMRAVLRGLSFEHRLQGSEAICRGVEAIDAWQEARAILFFMPLPFEPDLQPLMQRAREAGKTTALPVFISEEAGYEAGRIRHPETDLVEGKYGILEPDDHCEAFPLKQLDLILLPGLAFSVAGGRLGRGKGYYDRICDAASGARCGVAFDEQLIGADELPAEPHDQRMDWVITPQRRLDLASV